MEIRLIAESVEIKDVPYGQFTVRVKEETTKTMVVSKGFMRGKTKVEDKTLNWMYVMNNEADLTRNLSGWVERINKDIKPGENIRYSDIYSKVCVILAKVFDSKEEAQKFAVWFKEHIIRDELDKRRKRAEEYRSDSNYGSNGAYVGNIIW